MIFKVNGVDMLPYITDGGFKREEFALEAPNAGRTTMDGEMHRAIVSEKLKYTVTFRPLSEREAGIVLNALIPEFFEVEVTDARRGHITLTMYANNIPAQVAQITQNGEARWKGIVAPLIEQ